MWDLIVSVPDHCLSFYFVFCNLFTEKHDHFTYLLKSMYISLLLIMSLSVTLDTVDINQILYKYL